MASTVQPHKLAKRVGKLEVEHIALKAEQAMIAKRMDAFDVAQKRIDATLRTVISDVGGYHAAHGQQLDEQHKILELIAEKLTLMSASQAACAMFCQAKADQDERDERAKRDAQRTVR